MPDIPSAASHPGLSDLEIIEGLDAALVILYQKRCALSGGSLSIWQLVDHAASHLEKQIARLLRDGAE